MYMEATLGQIQQFGWHRPLMGWYFCHGQELLIKDNAALASLMGNFFGGDGTKTFKLPDLRIKKPNSNAYYNHGEIMSNGLPFLESQINVSGYYPAWGTTKGEGEGESH